MNYIKLKRKYFEIAFLKNIAEGLGFEPRQRLRVDRLAICSITTLAPLQFLMNLCDKIADANVPFHWQERKQFI